MTLERVMRGGSLVLLAWLVWRAAAPARARPASAVATDRTLAARLPGWTADPALGAAHLSLEAAPDPASRAWLRALAHAGVRVGWRGEVPPVALEVEPVNDPLRGVRVRVAGPSDARAVVGDDAGVIDTLRLTRGGSTMAMPVLAGAVRATVGLQTARLTPRDSVRRGEVLVLGRAGWEAKFVIAALEERGWRVRARLAVAPGIEVTQGEAAPLDTAHVAAVIALDTTAARQASTIARFVRAGGGLVLTGDAARAFAAIAPGALGPRVGPATLQFASTAPRRALGAYSIAALRADALPLEQRDGAVLAAARRLGAGRVVQVGYDESWRWRMLGGDGAPEAHRAFWSAVVSSAAYRATAPAATDASDDPAPLAALVAALGPASAPAAGTSHAAATALPWWAFALVTLCLLGEWSSRRLRGAR